jgi:hypothetical protein
MKFEESPLIFASGARCGVRPASRRVFKPDPNFRTSTQGAGVLATHSQQLTDPLPGWAELHQPAAQANPADDPEQQQSMRPRARIKSITTRTRLWLTRPTRGAGHGGGYEIEGRIRRRKTQGPSKPDPIDAGWRSDKSDGSQPIYPSIRPNHISGNRMCALGFPVTIRGRGGAGWVGKPGRRRRGAGDRRRRGPCPPSPCWWRGPRNRGAGERIEAQSKASLEGAFP